MMLVKDVSGTGHISKSSMPVLPKYKVVTTGTGQKQNVEIHLLDNANDYLGPDYSIYGLVMFQFQNCYPRQYYQALKNKSLKEKQVAAIELSAEKSQEHLNANGNST